MVDEENWSDMTYNEIRKSINNADATLKVMTWNIHDSTGKENTYKDVTDDRKSLVPVVLGISNPDVILLQEGPCEEDKILVDHIIPPFFDVRKTKHEGTSSAVMWKINCLAFVNVYIAIKAPTDDEKASAAEKGSAVKKGSVAEFLKWKTKIHGRIDKKQMSKQEKDAEEVLKRLTVVQLKQISSGQNCIFASYHGKYILQGEKLPQQIDLCRTAIYLVKFIASKWEVECDVIFGGDFNFDLELIRDNFKEEFQRPSTQHKTKSKIDWIIAFHSSSTTEGRDNIFYGSVNAMEVFPLPEQSRIWKEEVKETDSKLEQAGKAAETVAKVVVEEIRSKLKGAQSAAKKDAEEGVEAANTVHDKVEEVQQAAKIVAEKVSEARQAAKTFAEKVKDARQIAKKAAKEAETKSSSLWEPRGWKLLAKLYEKEPERFTSLYEENMENKKNPILDHSPMIAIVHLNQTSLLY